jgi:RNA polymerase sigma-70 factor (ECF subfamily)
LLTPDELTYHLEACKANNRKSQKIIYSAFYGYAMAICDRYTNKQNDALEILNDGFLKVFKEIYHYQPVYDDVISSFKGWLKKIIVYTAIDHYRKNLKYQGLIQLQNVLYEVPLTGEDALDHLSYEEIIKAVQDMTPGYRTVFNLFVIDGLSHEEIANQLGISTGTSKSNLSKARRQLQQLLFKMSHSEMKKNAV